MIKKLFLLSFFLSSFFIKAQVEISNNLIPQIDSVTDGIYVNFNNKGVLFPKVRLKSINSLETLDGPFVNMEYEDQMIVYNTNGLIGMGFYYWDVDKWRKIIDYENMFAQINIPEFYAAKGVSTLVLNANDYYGDRPVIEQYKKGMAYNDKSLARPFLSFSPKIIKEVVINSPKTFIGYNISGKYQMIDTKNPFSVSYTIGVFVDGKLYRPHKESLFSSLTTLDPCTTFNIYVDGAVTGLPKGKHTIEIMYHPRRAYQHEPVERSISSSIGINAKNCKVDKTMGVKSFFVVNEG